jgi:putative ABC transport system permease protein
MIRDVRYAFRQLAKHPGFAIITVLTLGMGIGASAAMFGLIHGVLLSPPPYAEQDRLVLISAARTDGRPYTQRPTTAHWTAWRDRSRSLESLALYGWTFNFLVLNEGSESLGGMVVNRDYFRVVGLKPTIGREFLDSEAGGGGSPPTAVIIGHDLWRRRFNADPQVLGKTLQISRMPAPLPIIGVMPAGVRFLPDPAAAAEPNYDVNALVDFWLLARVNESQPMSRGWNVVARMRSGVTSPAANAEIAAIAAEVAKSDPALEGLTATAQPLLDVANEEGRRLLVPLVGAVGLVFLIACANVAGLLLARGLQRQSEYALRSALGASWLRIARQSLTENLALALIGALVGGVLAAGMLVLFTAIGDQALPRVDAVSMGWPVFAFGLLAALLGALGSGLLPAARAALRSRFHGLEATRSTASPAERRLVAAVVVLQIVLTVGLLSGAALLIQTARNLARVRPGYDTENILALTVTAMQGDRWKAFHAEALERVATIPGVQYAAFAWGLPLTGNNWPGDIEIIGAATSDRLAERLTVPLRAVTPDYFAAMGIALVEGRPFRLTDDTDTPRVAIVNRSFVERHLGGSNALGRSIRPFGNAKVSIEIVGVVSDMRTDDLTGSSQPEVYYPLWQSRAFSKHLVVRTTNNPASVAPSVRRAIAAVDPTAAVEHVKTMAEIRRESQAPRRFAMHLLMGFSVVAMLLALIGVYGVLSLSVGSRTKEIAVRKAVGAEWHGIVRMVLGEGFRLVGLGVVLGAAIALAIGHLLSALLFEVQSTDPAMLTGAALLFSAFALTACAIPAWRATRVDLMEALRRE